jgi:hypothetical protein
VIIAAHGFWFEVPDTFVSVVPADPGPGPDDTVLRLRVGEPVEGPEVFDVDGAAGATFDDDVLVVWPLQELGPISFEHFVLDHLIPIGLGMAGETVLHGAGVALDGRGIVLAGSSGAGKSTLALWMADHGWDWLGDDAVRIAPSHIAGTGAGAEADLDGSGRDAAALLMWPSYPGARIHADGHETLFPGHRSAGLVAEYVAKERLVVPDRAMRDAPVPLHLFVLVDSDARPDAPVLTPLSVAETASALAQQTFLPRTSDTARAIDRLDRALALAPGIRALRLAHPRTPESLPTTAALLAGALAATTTDTGSTPGEPVADTATMAVEHHDGAGSGSDPTAPAGSRSASTRDDAPPGAESAARAD